MYAEFSDILDSEMFKVDELTFRFIYSRLLITILFSRRRTTIAPVSDVADRQRLRS